MKFKLLIFGIVFLLAFLFLTKSFFVQALEINYPTLNLPGVVAPTANSSLPEYINYFLNLFLWVSGLIGVVILVIGGIRYFISGVNPQAMSSAKNQISGAFFGILILFSIYLILNTINPQSTVIKLSPLPSINIPELPNYSPNPIDKFRTLINAEIPFGSLIETEVSPGPLPALGSTPGPIREESLFEGWRFQEKDETGRMDRIREIASNTKELAKNLLDNSQQLVSDKEGCNCESVGESNEPMGVCSGWPDPSAIRVQQGICQPIGTVNSPSDIIGAASQGNPEIIGDLSTLTGGQTDSALRIGETMAGIAGSQDNFTGLMSGLRNFSNVNLNSFSNVLQAGNIFGGLTGANNISPSVFFDSLTSAANIQNITSFSSTLNMVNRIGLNAETIFSNPTNLNSIFSSTQNILTNAGVDQNIINQVGDISRIVTANQSTLNNPADFLSVVQTSLQNQGVFNQYQNVFNNVITPIGGLLNNDPQITSINGLLRGAGLNQGAINNALGNFSGNFGGLINTVSQNPNNISEILRSTNSVLTSQAIQGPNLNNIQRINVLATVSALGDIINNHRDLGGVMNSLESAASQGTVTNANDWVVRLVSPLNPLLSSSAPSPYSPTFQNMFSTAISQILTNANVTQNSAFFNISAALQKIPEMIMKLIASGGKDVSAILEVVNTALGNVPIDQIQNLQNVIGPKYTDLQTTISQDPTNIAGIFTGINNILISAGANSDITVTLGGYAQRAVPLQGIINNPTDIQGIFSAARTFIPEASQGAIDNAASMITPLQDIIKDPKGMIFGFSQTQLPQMFTNLGVQNPSQIISTLSPIGNIVGTSNFSQLSNALNLFPNSKDLPVLFQGFQGLTSSMIDPSKFGLLMNQTSSLHDILGDDPTKFSSALNDFSALDNTFFESGATPEQLLDGFITSTGKTSCTCDACVKVRSQIQDTEKKNLTTLYGTDSPQGYSGTEQGDQIGYTPQSCKAGQTKCSPKQVTTNLLREQQKAIEEVKKLKEAIARLDEAERFMLACPTKFLVSLPEYLSNYDEFAKQGWFQKTTKYWDNVPTDQNGATVYCPVSGTVWNESTQNSPAMEKSLPKGELTACRTEIPAGDLIDRAKRLGNLLVKKLETLIELDGKMSKAVSELHALVSQCTSQSPKCNTQCDNIPVDPELDLWWCIPSCHAGAAGNPPCPTQEIDKKMQEIQGYYQRQNNNDSQGIYNVVFDPKSTKNGKETANTELQKLEETGIYPIIDDIIPLLIRDLDKLVREPARTCVNTGQNISGQYGKPLKQFLSCDGAIQGVNPNGSIIKNCCYGTDKTELNIKGVPAFNDCQNQCYLETDYKGPTGSQKEKDFTNSSDYDKCLYQCLHKKSQDQNNQDLETCVSKVNFYCCSLPNEPKSYPSPTP